MRNAFSAALYEAAMADPAIHIVVADISPVGSMNAFREAYPERFINVGVAEQAMIGICAGLALKGCKPFAYTIATFALYRPFEFVRDDLCYQNLPVTVVGMGAGLIYASLGGTHHSQEDVAVASALPNMQVLAPCDPLETADAVRHCAAQTAGPVYLRLGKAGEPVLTRDALEPFAFGRLRRLRAGRDICILSYGVILEQAIAVADALAARGRSVTLVSCHTLKPLDRDGIAALLHAHPQVVVIEEHAPQGGLAAHCQQIAWATGARCRLDCFTLKDEFIHCYGSQKDLLRRHGLAPDLILERLGA